MFFMSIIVNICSAFFYYIMWNYLLRLHADPRNFEILFLFFVLSFVAIIWSGQSPHGFAVSPRSGLSRKRLLPIFHFNKKNIKNIIYKKLEYIYLFFEYAKRFIKYIKQQNYKWVVLYLNIINLKFIFMKKLFYYLIYYFMFPAFFILNKYVKVKKTF